VKQVKSLYMVCSKYSLPSVVVVGVVVVVVGVVVEAESQETTIIHSSITPTLITLLH